MIKNQKIREEIEAVNWNDNEAVIEFYESNILYFENRPGLAQTDELEELVHIQISYVMALDSKNHYKKAAKILPKIDISIEKLKGEESFRKTNERYMFASGINAHRLKKFEDSQYYFSQLIEIDPQNDMYKSWYESNRDWLFYNNTKIVGIIGSFIVIIIPILGPQFGWANQLIIQIEILGILLFTFGFFGPQIKRYLKLIYNKLFL